MHGINNYADDEASEGVRNESLTRVRCTRTVEPDEDKLLNRCALKTVNQSRYELSITAASSCEISSDKRY
ncbi:unnamed protein product [Gongylonema pulchrum]|uniref:Uncharacterized protein n=1 Tax=Gongylonema pulchrum TaxID=637853 RepID=A0A183EP98_9BILA|nr:unnamed protein product [Gongylonema pulchrum]